jgi:hypothetical protein
MPVLSPLRLARSNFPLFDRISPASFDSSKLNDAQDIVNGGLSVDLPACCFARPGIPRAQREMKKKSRLQADPEAIGSGTPSPADAKEPLAICFPVSYNWEVSDGWRSSAGRASDL